MKKLKERAISKDIYFHLLNMSWLKLILSIFLLYLFGNILFALVYTLIPNSIGGDSPNFEQAFAFSVQTMSTIGYGALTPTGLSSNLIVFLESFLGLIMVAVITGVVFARLSRPKAQIRFSKNVLNTKHDGVQSLCLRIGNTRGNDIVEAKAHLSALFNEVTKEGERIRRIYHLDLIRNYSPFFQFSWLIVHPINEKSPFHHLNHKNGFEGLTLTVTGHDGTYSTTIYAQHMYGVEEMIKDRYFMDIMESAPSGSLTINYDHFDKLKPEGPLVK